MSMIECRADTTSSLRRYDRGTQSYNHSLVESNRLHSRPRPPMRDVVKQLLLFAIVLAVPIVPLLVWGELFAGQVAYWREAEIAPHRLAAAVVLVLASDILLPVPSSAVCTLAGARLGVIGGTVASWLGLTLGAVAAFAVARWWGRPLAERFSAADDLGRLERACRRNDLWMLIATRPLPVLAEACVLLVGLLGTPWPRFLAAISASHLVLAVTYAVLGDYALHNEWLTVALCVSLALPLLVATLARRYMMGKSHASPE